MATRKQWTLVWVFTLSCGLLHNARSAEQPSAPVKEGAVLILSATWYSAQPWIDRVARTYPREGWIGVLQRFKDTGELAGCELVRTSVRFDQQTDPEDPRVGVVPIGHTATNPPTWLVHGLPWQIGPVVCYVESRVEKLAIRHPLLPETNSIRAVYNYAGEGMSLYPEVTSNGALQVVMRQGKRLGVLYRSRPGISMKWYPQFVGDLDRDGKADLWLDLTLDSNCVSILYLSSRATSGSLVAEVARINFHCA